MLQSDNTNMAIARPIEQINPFVDSAPRVPSQKWSQLFHVPFQSKCDAAFYVFWPSLN
jgi:hypothetical protein